MSLVKAVFLALALAGVTSAAGAAPLPPGSLPTPLRSWVPWVMHGHEMLACPAPYNREQDADAEATPSCDWPSHLELQVNAGGAQFRFDVQVFGTPTLIELPSPLFNLALLAAEAAGRGAGLGEAAVRRMRSDLVFDPGPAQRDLNYAPRMFCPAAAMFETRED